MAVIKTQAQPPSKWYNKYGGFGIDHGYGIQETYNRQYIICGSTSSFGFGSNDAYLLLIDSMGQKVWEKSYGGAMTDIAKSILVNPVDSGFIFTGYTNSIGFGGYDVYLARTDKNGNLIWQKSFGGFDWDFGNDLKLTPDGHIVVCGYTYSKSYGKTDGYVLKLNSNTGTVIWEKHFGNIENDEFNSVMIPSDGSISLAGTSSLNGLTDDFWLFKLNQNGDSIHSKKISSAATNERCYDFIENKSNQFVFCGSFDTSAAMVGKFTSYLIKTDLNGNFISETKFYGGGLNDEKFISICNEKNKSNFCLARKIDHGIFKLDYQPFLIDNNFNYIASTTVGDMEDEESYNIESTSDNGFIMVGYTKSYGSPLEDVFVLKMDSTIFNTQSLVGIKDIDEPTDDFVLYHNDNTIFFTNKNNDLTEIRIYDINGKLQENAKLTGQNLILKTNKPGVYFCTLFQGNRIRKLKFVLN